MKRLRLTEQDYLRLLIDWINSWTQTTKNGVRVAYGPAPKWVKNKRFKKIRNEYIRFHNMMYPNKPECRHRWELNQICLPSVEFCRGP